MSEANWTVLNDGLDIATVDRGATSGITPPSGGGSYIYGFNSLAAAEGAVGLFCNALNYAPMAKGGSIRGCIQRGPGGGPTGFSPFFFLAGQGPSVNDSAYLIGLSDDVPHRVVIKKGMIANGIGGYDSVGVLRASTSTFAQGTWLHLRLDVTLQDNGDVILEAWRNDLDAHPLGTPESWVLIPGLTDFVDDQLGINSGSQPFTSGRAGFGFRVDDVTRRGFFDHIELMRQV